MTLFIQEHITEDVFFSTNDFVVIPDKGENVMVDNELYIVVERIFSFKHLTNIDSNSCTLFVKPYK